MPELIRSKKILEMYKEGMTLEEIAGIFRFTRARAQQIVSKELGKEIIKEIGCVPRSIEERSQMKAAVREIIKDIYLQRETEKTRQHEQEIKNKVSGSMPDPANFISLRDYSRAVDLSVVEIQKFFPDIAEEIINRRKKKWSLNYNKCRSCGTTSVKHRGHGLCEDCYVRSDYFKEMQEQCRFRNKEKWKKNQRAYVRKYIRRPYVVERRKKRWDEKYFGGNRERAMERDGYKCQICGMSKEESLKKFGRDLYITHLNKIQNNELRNLLTICQECHNKRGVIRMRQKLLNRIK